jgi:hypothetical protein
MKRTLIKAGVVIAAVVVCLAGCELFGDPAAMKLVGTWDLSYTWTGSSESSTAFTLSWDYTWTDDQNYSGTWSLEGTTFTRTFDSGTVYTGTVDSTGTTMSGTMVAWNGNTGVWDATKR